MSSASWLPTLTTSIVSGSIGVTGVLAGSWLTARRDDRRQAREIEREHNGWNREDERRWVEQRRAIYVQYLEAVRPWMHHARHWTGPFLEPKAITKEGLQNDEGVFDFTTVSRSISALESELTLIASEDVRKSARQLHAQLIAFEATLISGELRAIDVMGRNCEHPYDRLVWSFRMDLGVPAVEPSWKHPSKTESPTSESPLEDALPVAPQSPVPLEPGEAVPSD